MELDRLKVHEKYLYCLTKTVGVEAIKVQAVGLEAKFHKKRLEESRLEIYGMLLDLPMGFRDKYGGMSASALRFTAEGKLWADNTRTCDMLLAMALGLELATFKTPRETWHLLPGGVPFVEIHLRSPFHSP